ncbi:hypothetical protein PybrP1_007736 [[Pythium] brassicae (nom. inval.)]|nr:hypothetical protein PybrP1_007736 [[Pythium] brassicae (nom. inval.)]
MTRHALADLLAALVKAELGERADLELVFELLDLRERHVELRERHGARVLGREFEHERLDLLALAAPGRLELGDHGLAGLHELLKVLLGLDNCEQPRVGAVGVVVVCDRRKVLVRVLRVREDRLVARLPVRRAHFAVLLDKLQRLDEPERLVHAPADREVVDRHLLQHALRVDDEQPAQRNASALEQHAVLGRDELRNVGHDRDVHLAEPTLVARELGPRQVRLGRIRRHGDELRVHGLELGRAIVERDDLGRAHVRKVLRVEKHDHVLAAVVVQRDLRDVVVQDRGGFKARRRRLHARRGRRVLDRVLVVLVLLVVVLAEDVVVVAVRREAARERTRLQRRLRERSERARRRAADERGCTGRGGRRGSAQRSGGGEAAEHLHGAHDWSCVGRR